MTPRRTFFALIALLALPVYLSLQSNDDLAPADTRLIGLWAQFDARQSGDPVRFYYFHPRDEREAKPQGPARAGIGLYRYGRMGLNNTNSYTWSADAKTLTLNFNKTGREVKSEFRLETDADGTEVLILLQDPYEPRPVRYRKQPPPEGLGSTDALAKKGHPFSRMWIHQNRFKTGGMQFSIYQFKPPALDGRGVGWFHRGDFDDWFTETLTYRKTAGQVASQIELSFPLRKERHVSALRLGQAEGRRLLDLAKDPRNFWQRQIYVDGGASFGANLLGGPLPIDALAAGALPR